MCGERELESERQSERDSGKMRAYAGVYVCAYVCMYGCVCDCEEMRGNRHSVALFLWLTHTLSLELFRTHTQKHILSLPFSTSISFALSHIHTSTLSHAHVLAHCQMTTFIDCCSRKPRRSSFLVVSAASSTTAAAAFSCFKFFP